MFRTKWFKIGLGITILAVIASLVILQYGRGRTTPVAADPAASKEKEKENPQLPAYVLPPVALPGRFPDADLTTAKFDPSTIVEYNHENRIKPGHWATVMTTMVSTERDAQARFLARMTKATGETVPVLDTDRWLNAIRTLSLPKGQWKQVETMTYVSPRSDIQTLSSASFQFDLLFGSSTYPVESFRQPTIMLAPNQYMITVFDQRPGQFGFLNRLDCIQGFSPLFWQRLVAATFTEGLFHCTGSQPNDPAPWPRSALTATIVAHAIWSDFDPDKMDQAQQTALVDWIHWGGNLVINGPVALERLSGSFLEPYLPAKIEQRVMLTTDELVQFLKPWSVISPELRSLAGCYLEPLGDGQLLDNSKLFCERSIGRGRIVALGFSLDSEPLYRWPCFSNFFNAAILRKPGRYVFFRDPANGESYPEIRDNELGQSRLHFLSRDGGKPDGSYGNASWNDRSEVARAAAQILRTRSAFKPPSSEFVLKVLAAYLVLLIPLNWLLFRWLGRLEWAWVAAPVISIIGAIAVTKLAALDVGFARALDTVTVLELQGGYDRGHLAEYSALYSSLSKNFVFAFEQNDALFLPMATHSDKDAENQPSYRAEKALLAVNCSRGLKTEIDNFLIRSNTTGHIHAERMVPVGGAISLISESITGRLVVDNQSGLILEDAIVLRAVGGGYEVARFARLEPKSRSDELRFSIVALGDDQSAEMTRWLANNRPTSEIDLSEILAAACSAQDLSAGEYRLVARCDNEISPMICEPAPTRSNRTTLVSVRLRSVLPTIERDSDRLWSFYQPIAAETYLENDESDQ